LVVLNPGGHDPEQYFDKPVTPESGRHAPVNFHGYAACTDGSFHRETSHAIEEKSPILLLLRGNLKAAARAMKECRAANRTVLVSLKETGLHQVAELLGHPAVIDRFSEIINQANGCIAATPEIAEFYRLARPRSHPATVAFVPTPYPLGEKAWDLSIRADQQSGIFIGTREWHIPPRNHFAGLMMAKNLCERIGETATVFNMDGRKGRRLLEAVKFPAGKLRVIEDEKAYPEYLREVAKHKIVLQLDRSRVPGQVAGDALLCRLVCVGGDSAIERIAFPKSSGAGRTFEQVEAIASELLTNHNARGTAFVESQWRSMEQLSFEAVGKRLQEFLKALSVVDR
jgi:hypothetical protein